MLWLAHICVVCNDLGDNCCARFAEFKDTTARNEYRLTIGLLQFHEVLMHDATGTTRGGDYLLL